MMLPPEALVLVGVLPAPRDLEIARVLGWYRIPLKTAPKNVAVDFLAFYQTGKFADGKWMIRHFAQVLGHELVTRAELLRDEPEHARATEQYYKLQLGALQSLAQPIVSAQWRRITFFYTLGEHLNTASEINELMMGSTERELLWSALRERNLPAEKQYQPAPHLPALDLALLCQLGGLGITIGDSAPQAAAGWQGLHIPSSAVRSDPAGCADQIAAAVAELSGLKQAPA